MHFTPTFIFLAVAALVSATLDPARSNTKDHCPKVYNCYASKNSTAIQAAECSHNTRTRMQTFAVFVTDHKYDGVYGHPYGTCYAYSCKEPTPDQMGPENSDCHTFFWSKNGNETGFGTDCIRDPGTNECGCENSKDGKFIPGKNDCV